MKRVKRAQTLSRVAPERSPGLKEAIMRAGSIRKLAAMLGCSHVAVTLWKQVPAERVRDIEAATGVPRQMLRPDLFDGPDFSSYTSKHELADKITRAAQTLDRAYRELNDLLRELEGMR